MKLLKLSLVAFATASTLQDELNTLMTDNQCFIYSKAASYAIQNALKMADQFGTFGDFKDVVLMEDIEDSNTRDKILQATVCDKLCDSDNEKHPFCKELALSLEIEELGKMALFKSVIKKYDVYTTPVLKYSKIMARKFLSKIDSLSAENIQKVDEAIKQVIEENANVEALAGQMQKVLNKFKVPVDLEKLIKNDPKKILKTGKKIIRNCKRKNFHQKRRWKIKF